jgi:hypothetical protein
MSMPLPRPATDLDIVSREDFLATFEVLYEHLREGSRAQLHHAVLMTRRELGGVLIFQLPSKQAKRQRPEVAYVSELPDGIKVV